MSAPYGITLLPAGRQAGKTTQAFAWVSHGERCAGYPGWTRVLVLAHSTAYEISRRRYWARLEDFDHRVYRADDWARAHGVRPDTRVCVDDLDWALSRHTLFGMPGLLAAATITAAAWEPLTFREKRPEPELRAGRVTLPQRGEGEW